MLIHQLSRETRVPVKTIRYYEAVGLIPPPPRTANNYRQYSDADVERLRFVASGRRLGLGLADLREIVTARDNGQAPCERVLTAMDQSLLELDLRLADLLGLHETLMQLRQEGAGLPRNDVEGKACVCSLVKAYGKTGAGALPAPTPANGREARS